MVTINFKLSELGRVEVPLKEDEALASVLDKAALLAKIEPTSFEQKGLMVIRQGRVLRGTDLVTNLDEIEVFPAISGG